MLRWANEWDMPIIRYYSKQLFTQKNNQYGMNLDKYEELVNMYITNGWAHYLVEEREGEMVGWILFGKNVDPMDGSERGFLYEMFVLPLYRRQGIGRLLMNTAIEELLKRGYTDIQLNVYAGNVGKKLYEELGFVDRQTLMIYQKQRKP
ncbi:MAG: GNAT family N-acetyltransferase [Bacillaceae bacterium]